METYLQGLMADMTMHFKETIEEETRARNNASNALRQECAAALDSIRRELQDLKQRQLQQTTPRQTQDIQGALSKVQAETSEQERQLKQVEKRCMESIEAETASRTKLAAEVRGNLLAAVSSSFQQEGTTLKSSSKQDNLQSQLQEQLQGQLEQLERMKAEMTGKMQEHQDMKSRIGELERGAQSVRSKVDQKLVHIKQSEDYFAQMQHWNEEAMLQVRQQDNMRQPKKEDLSQNGRQALPQAPGRPGIQQQKQLQPAPPARLQA